MTTLMETLTVLRPRGQRAEVFHDSELDRLQKKSECWREGWCRTYSYRVLPGNVLKIYSHRTRLDHHGNWKADNAENGLEVAHFRPNQWDSVRSGRKAA